MRSNTPSIDFSSSDVVIVMVGGKGISRSFRNNSVDVVDTLATTDSVLGTESNELLLFRGVITLSAE